MMSPSQLADNLALLAHETSLLTRTALAFDDESIRVPSRCAGWTRAHVLAHIARNADALGNLVTWALTGTPRAMYESAQARDDDIEAGSTRSAPEIMTDLMDSAARFAATASALSSPSGQVEVELRAGRRVTAGQLPTLRLLEVVIHHVDLDAGYTFADADPGFVRRAITNAVGRMGTTDRVPSLSLLGDSGEQWSLGDGSQEVTGTSAALLLWLTRGDDVGVTSALPLPELPPWG